MAMQKYLVAEAFTLSVINNPALSMGLTTKVGEVIFYDGFNVEYNGIRDASVSLKSAIREGWLRAVSEDEVLDEYIPTTTPKTKQATEMFDSVVPTSTSSSNNNGHLVMVTGSSANRGMPTDTVEGNIVKKTAFDDAGSYQNKVVPASTERQKLSVVNMEDSEIITPLKGDREAVSMSTHGDSIKMSARAVTSKQHYLIENVGDNPPPSDGDYIPMRRQVPAKMTMELDAQSPSSESAFDNMISKKAGLGKQGSTLEAVSTVFSEPSGLDVEASVTRTRTMESSAISVQEDQSLSLLDSDTTQVRTAPIGQKTHTSSINEAEQTPRKKLDDFQSRKDEATARLKAKRLAATQGSPAQEEPTPAVKPKIVKKVNSKAPVKTKAKTPVTKKKTEGPVSVKDLVVGGKKWESVDYKAKAEYARTLKDPRVLEAIRTDNKSHWSVRKAAKEQMTSIA